MSWTLLDDKEGGSMEALFLGSFVLFYFFHTKGL